MRPHYLLLLLVLALGFSCHDLTSPAPDGQRVGSIVVDDEPLPSLIPPVHPDTVYASADSFEYVVEVYDTLTSGSVAGYTDLYAQAPGILTFRGSLGRTAPYVGRVSGTPDTLIAVWRYRSKFDSRKTNYGVWGGGTGWTGQPLYVEWPDSVLDAFRADSAVRLSLTGRSEVIVASLDSKVFFLDFATGQASRDSIYVRNPIKGTPSLDPTLSGLLYLGHGVLADKDYGWGQFTIDLHSHSICQFRGRDVRAQRSWNGNDSSPLRVGRFVFHPSEDGTLYKWLVTPEGRTLHSTLRYKSQGSAPGFEASMSAWGNYGYLADNHGNVLCVNLDNLRVVWRYDNHDDNDCSPMLLHEEDGTYVYAGSEVDLHPRDSVCHFVKLNALTGERVWELNAPAWRTYYKDKHFDGGYYASPLPGQGNCADLIFVNRVVNRRSHAGSTMSGCFVAIDRHTGEERYAVRLKSYAWSSPVGLVNEEGRYFVLTFDTQGNCYLIDGLTGRLLHSSKVGGNFESSPIIVGNEVVIGSRNGNIYKFRIE